MSVEFYSKQIEGFKKNIEELQDEISHNEGLIGAAMVLLDAASGKKKRKVIFARGELVDGLMSVVEEHGPINSKEAARLLREKFDVSDITDAELVKACSSRLSDMYKRGEIDAVKKGRMFEYSIRSESTLNEFVDPRQVLLSNE